MKHNHDNPNNPAIEPFNQPVDMPPPSEGFDFHKYLHLILEKRWLILRVAVLVAALGIVWLFRQEDIYRAVATFEVNKSEQNIVDIEDVSADRVSSDDVLQTTIAKVTSSRVLQKVVLSGALSAYPNYKIPEELPPDDLDTWALSRGRNLRQFVTTRLQSGTRIVSVAVEHTDPEFCADLANALVTTFIDYNLNEKLEANQSANKILIAESERLKKKLRVSEEALVAYQQDSEVGSVLEEQTAVTAKLEALNSQLVAEQTKRAQLEIDLNRIREHQGEILQLVELESIRADVRVVSMLAKFTDQQALVNAYKKRYKPKYPKMIRAREQLAEYRTDLDRAIAEAVNQLSVQLSQTKAREAKLRESLNAVESQSLEVRQASIEYNVLQREIESDRALLDAVMTRMKETDLTKGIRGSAIFPAETALTPNDPVRPDRERGIALWIAVGLACGMGLVFFIDFIDQSVKTVDEAETKFQLPVLAAVPEDPLALKKGLSAESEDRKGGKLISEAFRTSIAAIRMLRPDDQQKVILVTSAIPGEGKTYSAYNLALNYASLNQRTLLVDLDLRKPSIHRIDDRFAGVDHGVSEMLLRRADYSDLVVSGGAENLDVLLAGERLPNPVEQLSDTKTMSELFNSLRQRYDRIVVDTAPVNAVADTLYLAGLADIICFVVRSGKTSYKVVDRGIEAIERAGARVSGLFLNVMPRRSGHGYYYYYYNHYGPKGVYGAEEEKRSSKARSAGA